MSDKTISLFDGPDRSERGQVGIGTLIVFIALVLVAAIAAGVLINTAGLLQTQSEQTGEETQDQVANNINVIGSVGNVSEGGENISEIRIAVQPSPGSDDINLADLSIQYVGDNGFAQITANASGESKFFADNDADNHTFGVQAISAETEGDAIMTDRTDRYEVIISLDDTIDDPVLDSLQEGDEAQLTITTGDGSQVVELIQAPDSLVGYDGGETVTL